MTDAVLRRIEDAQKFKAKYAGYIFEVWSESYGNLEFLGYHKSYDKSLSAASEHFHKWFLDQMGYFPFAFAYRTLTYHGFQRLSAGCGPYYLLCPVKLRVANQRKFDGDN